MCGDRFSSSTTCSRWRHETEPGRLDQSLSCRFWKVATHPVDKNPAYPIAFEAIKHEGFFRPRSSLRQCKYLNNVIEQDHRFIKRRTRPMLGFKQFTTAWRTVRGIEMMHALRKGQARWMAKGDVVGQTQLIHKVFGLAV